MTLDRVLRKIEGRNDVPVASDILSLINEKSGKHDVPFPSTLIVASKNGYQVRQIIYDASGESVSVLLHENIISGLSIESFIESQSYYADNKELTIITYHEKLPEFKQYTLLEDRSGVLIYERQGRKMYIIPVTVPNEKRKVLAPSDQGVWRRGKGRISFDTKPSDGAA